MNAAKVIRWIWIMNLLLAVLALLYWLAGPAQAFTDAVSCTIQGKVYKLTDTELITFAPGNTCAGIRISADERHLVIYSPHHWVAVPIASEKGWRMFQYRWGAEVAHLGAATVPVHWGIVERG